MTQRRPTDIVRRREESREKTDLGKRRRRAAAPKRAENAKPASMAQVPGSGTGVNRKACRAPLWSPLPTICPASLMALASVNVQPEPGSIRLFRSVIVDPSVKEGVRGSRCR